VRKKRGVVSEKSAGVKIETPARVETSGMPKWIWIAGLVGASIIVYWLIREDPVKVEFVKICTFTQMTREHCCSEDLIRLQMRETGNMVYVTVVTDRELKDEKILGVLEDAMGNEVLTGNITFSKNPDDICYSTIISPANGVGWRPGKYVLTLFVNGERSGEKSFEILGY
jgi:hypothetical protein